MNLKPLCGWIPPCYLLFQNALVYAEVRTDGSLGPATNLMAPNYRIGAELGQQYGGNLFHSFSQFNLTPSETATFAGPGNVTNIIARVTGGIRSDLDGTLRSEIPHANLYLINPMGIRFGPNAQLEVSGAFHASTADYLQLGEDGRFDAIQPTNSILTVAPPTAFGFLGPSPVSVIEHEGQFFVADQQSISLVGGKLSITGKLRAPQGRIMLHTVTTAGEVSVNPETEARLETGGDITISSENAELSTETSSKDKAGGDIFIRAGNLTIRDLALLHSNTQGGSDAGQIEIKTNHLALRDSANIASNTWGGGQGGTIRIEANSFEMHNDTLINVSSEETAHPAGQIIIIAGDFKMSNGSIIDATTTGTTGSGSGGQVNINARRLVMIDTSKILSSTFNSGRGGNIQIQVQDLSLAGHTVIDSSTQSTGAGGNVTLQVAGRAIVADTVTISAASGGDNVFTREIKNLAELADRLGAESNVNFSGGGQAGKVCISRGGTVCDSESMVILAKTVTAVPQLRNCPDKDSKNRFSVGKRQGVGRSPEDLF